MTRTTLLWSLVLLLAPLTILHAAAANAGKKPFFLYVAHIAPHWPLQAKPEDIEKYHGRYDIGWDAVRSAGRARELALQVGLEGRLEHRPAELSGGQMQRVAVVRALINAPQLLLADEPTGSLDKAASENIADLLVELNESVGVTLITVTHSMKLAERMGKVIEISDGRLV